MRVGEMLDERCRCTVSGEEVSSDVKYELAMALSSVHQPKPCGCSILRYDTDSVEAVGTADEGGRSDRVDGEQVLPHYFVSLRCQGRSGAVPDSTTCTDRRRHLFDEATSTPILRASALILGTS